MKPYIDFQATITRDMLASKRFKHRLIKYWGTTYVNGVHVFNKTYQFFPNHKAERHRRLYRLFNIDDQMMKQSIQRSQVDECHFYFKKKVWTGVPILERELLANKINNFFPAMVKKRITLKMIDLSNPDRFKGWTKEQILEYVDTNYETLINSTNVETTAGTMAEDAVCLYAMLDNEGVFTVNVIEAGVAPLKDYKSIYTGTSSTNEVGELVYDTKDIVTLKTSIYLTLDITRNTLVLDNSQFINAVMRENSELRKRNLEMLQSSTENISYQEAVRRELDDDNNDTEENDFFIGKYLKVACTESYFMNRDKFIRNVFSSLDTNIEYKKKDKLSTWERIGFILIFVALIVLNVLTGGATTPLTVAYIATVTMFIYLAIQISYANSGESVKAESMGKYVKVAGIVSAVLNIANIIQDFFKEVPKQAATGAATQGAATASAETATAATTEAAVQASTQAAVTEGVKEVGREIVGESLEAFLASSSETIIAPAAEGLSLEAGNVAFTYGGKTVIEIGAKNLITKAMELVMKLVGGREQARVKSAVDNKTYLLNEANEASKSTSEQLMELDDRTLHIGVTDIIASTKLLKTSQAQFEVDYLYEGSAFNIGRPSFRPYGLNERVKIEYKI